VVSSPIERRSAVQRPDPRMAAQSFISRNPIMAAQGTGLSGSGVFLPGETSAGIGVSSAKSGLFGASEGTGRRVGAVAAGAQRLRQIHEAGVAFKKQKEEQELARQEQQRAQFEQQTSGRQQAGDVRMQQRFNHWAQDGKLSGSRNSLLQDASSYLGTRYQLGGRSYKGIDCSGLVMNVYNKLGFNISVHGAKWQGRNIPGVRTSVNNLKPGDIVAWKDGSHIAIYAGNGEIIEAANPRVGTVRRRLWARPDQVFGIAVRLPGE
jgi:cell wall-associated NlpC family hydrolase